MSKMHVLTVLTAASALTLVSVRAERAAKNADGLSASATCMTKPC